MTTAVRVSEAEFTTAVLDAAALLGYRLRYHTHDSRKSREGFPDWVLTRTIGTPRTVYLELKGSTGQPTRDQQEWIEGLIASGEDARCYWPDQWDDLVEWLR